MECSEVKVKVTQNKTTPVKYRYLKNVLKYSNEVVVLRYWPPLSVMQGFEWSVSVSQGITPQDLTDGQQDPFSGVSGDQGFPSVTRYWQVADWAAFFLMRTDVSRSQSISKPQDVYEDFNLLILLHVLSFK